MSENFTFPCLQDVFERFERFSYPFNQFFTCFQSFWCCWQSLGKECLYLELFLSTFFQHFPAFGLTTETDYSVRIRQNVGKMGTRIIPNTDTFYAVSWVNVFPIFSLNSLQNALRLVSASLNTRLHCPTKFNFWMKANVAFKINFSSWFQNFTTCFCSMYQFFSIYTGLCSYLYTICRVPINLVSISTLLFYKEWVSRKFSH